MRSYRSDTAIDSRSWSPLWSHVYHVCKPVKRENDQHSAWDKNISVTWNIITGELTDGQQQTCVHILRDMLLILFLWGFRTKLTPFYATSLLFQPSCPGSNRFSSFGINQSLCVFVYTYICLKKYGSRVSVDKNLGRRPRFLSLLRLEGHVFHTAWKTMIKSDNTFCRSL